MKVIICPGVHDTQLTTSFVNSLKRHHDIELDCLVFPTDKKPAYSSLALYQWLDEQKILTQEVLFICFSAGVVAGIGAAFLLQLKGIKIKAFIAIDGWGVPLWANFPVYRLSHDYFTYWSSAFLGTGSSSFYCDPSVTHLSLWKLPESCQGWVSKLNDKQQLTINMRCSAIDYINSILVETLQTK